MSRILSLARFSTVWFRPASWRACVACAAVCACASSPVSYTHLDVYKRQEYYGFFDIFGRYASVMGTLLVSVVTSLTHDPSLGVLSIGILLVVGLVMLVKLSRMQEARV